MTPRASRWARPSFPPPTGVMVGGPYGSLDAAPPAVRRGPPAASSRPAPPGAARASNRVRPHS